MVRVSRLAGLVAAIVVGAAPMARAQQVPADIEVTIQKVLTQTRPLVAAYKAQQEAAARAPKADPYAAIKAQSKRLSPAQKAETISIFTSAYNIWKAGDMSAARLAFERGLAIDPANAAANFYEGDILARARDTAGAAVHYKRAVALGGTSTEAFRAEAALKALPGQDPDDPALDAMPAIWRVDGVGANFRDCASCPELVILPAGSFTMGSPASEPARADKEGPRHRVIIENPIAVGRFEVTFAEWDACVSAGGCDQSNNDERGWGRATDEGWGRGSRPLIKITWMDALDYVSWISKKTGKKYRLLTEAEWEYSARAGSNTAFYWGATIGSGNANCEGCGSSWDNSKTAPVGSFKPNAFGIYDTAGNVQEWTQDCERDYAGAPADGSAKPSDDCYRIIRGGGFRDSPVSLRSGSRDEDLPGWYYKDLGFRIARTL